MSSHGKPFIEDFIPIPKDERLSSYDTSFAQTFPKKFPRFSNSENRDPKAWVS